jgi:hypothetical protein
MRQVSSVELDLIVGGYGEDSGGGFDESVFEPRATLNEDGSYSLEVTEAEYSSNLAAAEADHWEITGTVTTYDANGNIMTQVRVGRSSNAC